MHCEEGALLHHAVHRQHADCKRLAWAVAVRRLGLNELVVAPDKIPDGKLAGHLVLIFVAVVANGLRGEAIHVRAGQRPVRPAEQSVAPIDLMPSQLARLGLEGHRADGVLPGLDGDLRVVHRVQDQIIAWTWIRRYRLWQRRTERPWMQVTGIERKRIKRTWEVSGLKRNRLFVARVRHWFLMLPRIRIRRTRRAD